MLRYTRKERKVKPQKIKRREANKMAFRHSFSVGFMARQNKPDTVTKKILAHFTSVPVKAGRTAIKADKAKK